MDYAELKCSFCKKFLSIGPIFTSEDGTINRCGRCRNDQLLLRNVLFEKLAKHMTFPCSMSSECTETLNWDDVAKHETICLYNEIVCPFDGCEESYAAIKIENHFLQKHSVIEQKGHNIVMHIPWKKIDFTGYKVSFIKVGQHSFLTFVVIDDNFFWMDMYSISRKQPETTFFASIVGYNASIEISNSKPVTTYPGIEAIHSSESRPNVMRIKVNKAGIFDLMEMTDSSSDLTIVLEINVKNSSSDYITRNQCEGMIRRALSCYRCQKIILGQCFFVAGGYSVCSNCSSYSVLGRNYVIESLIEKLKIHHPDLENPNREFVGMY